MSKKPKFRVGNVVRYPGYPQHRYMITDIIGNGNLELKCLETGAAQFDYYVADAFELVLNGIERMVNLCSN